MELLKRCGLSTILVSLLGCGSSQHSDLTGEYSGTGMILSNTCEASVSTTSTIDFAVTGGDGDYSVVTASGSVTPQQSDDVLLFSITLPENSGGCTGSGTVQIRADLSPNLVATETLSLDDTCNGSTVNCSVVYTVPLIKHVYSAGSANTASGSSDMGPIASGSYVADYTLDSNYTTCGGSTCSPASFQIDYSFTYESSAQSYLVSDTSSSATFQVQNGNQLEWQTAPGPFTDPNGCAATASGSTLIDLCGNYFVGGFVETVKTEACNGAQSSSCFCAYGISGTRQ